MAGSPVADPSVRSIMRFPAPAIVGRHGLGVSADGVDSGGPQPPGHVTIYPTETMSFNQFSKVIKGLPWEPTP